MSFLEKKNCEYIYMYINVIKIFTNIKNVQPTAYE